MSIKINVLVDDRINIHEHGLSILIEIGEIKILFDTAQTRQYLEELESLEKKITDINAIIISHGHYDHANGLMYLENNLPIYIHKDALMPKYKYVNGNFKFNGIDLDAIEKNNNNFVFVDNKFEIFPDVYIFGNVKNNNHNDKFLLDQNTESVDDFHDEIGLVIEEEDGLSVFVGCSHFGIENALVRLKEIFPNKIVKNLIGGMHLINQDYDKIIILVRKLKDMNIKTIYPLHCTGDLGVKVFKEIFKDKCYIIENSETVIL